MALLQSCFESALQECISSLNVIVNSTLTTTANELVLAAAAADQISPDRKSVAKMQFLPDLNKCNLPNGTLVYVENIYTYVLSYNKCWIGLDGRLFNNNCRNELFTWGANCDGLLAIGNSATLARCSPVREFCSATDWCEVSASLIHVGAIKYNGQLWTWGRNNYGQLGIGNSATIARCSPVREFCSASDWCYISTGGNGTIASTHAIKTSGQLWSWGNNGNGELGIGSTIRSCSPVREFCSASDWCMVSSSTRYAVGLKTTGQIWSWGCNGSGSLGIGSVTCTCSPVREFCSASDWCTVSAKNGHTVAIKTNGQLWAWGSNNNGQLGDGSTFVRSSPVREFCSATDWCFVNAGIFLTFGIKTNGQLWAWGSNSVGGNMGIGISGSQFNSPVREFCSATDWCQVSGNGNFSLGIKTSGQIWGWGNNTNGELARGNATTSCSPVREFCSSTDWSKISVGCIFSTAIKVTRNI